MRAFMIARHAHTVIYGVGVLLCAYEALRVSLRLCASAVRRAFLLLCAYEALRAFLLLPFGVVVLP